MFKSKELYSRKDLYKILNVPVDRQKGNWNTGYNQYDNKYYIFAGIETAGRTGHNYGNHWEDSLLFWRGKRGSNIRQNAIKELLNKKTEIHIFTRTNNIENFVYQGLGVAEKHEDTIPVTIYWRIIEQDLHDGYDEVDSNNVYIEGARKEVLVNVYERNKEARKECINYYGCKCTICDYDFKKVYGKIGEGFIHVHHLKPLSEINEGYKIDPIKDLKPVCPNCHAMLHRRVPPYTIDELKSIIK